MFFLSTYNFTSIYNQFPQGLLSISFSIDLLFTAWRTLMEHFKNTSAGAPALKILISFVWGGTQS